MSNPVLHDSNAPFSPAKGSSSRSISVWVRPNSHSNSSNTSTLTKIKKQVSRDGVRLRRSDTEAVPQSQWYAPDLVSKQEQPVIELSEHLSSQRPLRTEFERRLSRPNSGQYMRAQPTHSPTRSMSQGASSSTLSLSPHSFSISESSDDKPPPLPVKQSYADYSNLSENGNSNGFDLTLLPPKRHSGSIGSAIKHKVSDAIMLFF